MKNFLACAATVAAFLLTVPDAALAQGQPPEAVVSIYRAAPGHQVMLLKWFEQQQRADAAAGVPPTQLYVHQDGDSWDYVLIAPKLTDAQEDAVDAAAKRLGIPTGPGVGFELRKHIAVHTDTSVVGPITVADYLRRIGQ